MENVLHLTMKAFQLHGVLRRTLILTFEQIKPILKRYMKENHVLRLEVNLKNKHAFALEPICNGEREAWLRLWLNDEISTKQLRKRMKERFQWVEYLNFADFLNDVEAWLKLKERVRYG